MRYPVSLGMGLLAAFFFVVAGVITAVRAIRSQGGDRRFYTLASVVNMLSACTWIAFNVWLWVIPHH
jgi:hypothetical protein